MGRDSNRSAIGAKVRVTTASGVQIDEVRSGASYLSQSALTLHFGLGASTAPPKVEIRWPSGATQAFTPAGIDRMLTVVEGAGPTAP